MIGTQTPRVESIPACLTNSAADAIDLYEAYGSPTDDWQQYVLTGWLGENTDGWAAPRAGLAVARQNGKGTALEARELFGLVILGERILHTAHEVKTSKDHFRRMVELFDHPDLKRLVRKTVNTNGEEAIWLHNGGVIRFVARSKNSGRGFSADLLVCDEAQDLDDDKFAALLPTISASPNPQTILAGTPPAPNMSGQVFERFRDAGIEGNDERLCWLEWSADIAKQLDDPEAWAEANPALDIRLSVEKIADERAAMDDETFARERLGRWTGVGTSSLFDMERWSTLVSHVTPDDPVAFAVDVSPDLGTTSIGVAGFIGDAIHVEIVAHKKGTGWVPEALQKLKEQWSPVAIVIDQGSPAASLMPDLDAHRIRVVQFGTGQVVQACGSFYNNFMNDKLVHANQPALNAAVQAATKRPVRDSFAWNRKNPNADITPLVAVSLAAHGLSTKRKPRERTPQRRKVALL